MKSFLIVVALCSTLAFVRVTSASSDLEDIENKKKFLENRKVALEECNATIPVQRDPGMMIYYGIFAAKPLNLSQDEKCFLHCYLQKVGFLDENANIKYGKEFIQYTIGSDDSLTDYGNVIIASLFQFSRVTRGIQDKCLKSFIIHQQFVTTCLTLNVAENLQQRIKINDKIVKYIQTGQKIDPEVENRIIRGLEATDFVYKYFYGTKI